MENASKALLMAGGILIAILIIGAVTFMFRDVTEAQRAQQESKKLEQINEYNKQFAGYERKLYGHELLSLINKIINTNRKNAEQNKYVNTSKGEGYEPITINVVESGIYNINTAPKSKDDLAGPYKKFLELKKKIDEDYNMSEEDFKEITKLKNRIKTGSASDAQKAQLQLDDLLRKLHKTESDIENSDIELYQSYLDFKETRFQYDKTEYDAKTGRIKYMKFKKI